MPDSVWRTWIRFVLPIRTILFVIIVAVVLTEPPSVSIAGSIVAIQISTKFEGLSRLALIIAEIELASMNHCCI